MFRDRYVAVIFTPGFVPEWVVLLPSIATIDRSKHFDTTLLDEGAARRWGRAGRGRGRYIPAWRAREGGRGDRDKGIDTGRDTGTGTAGNKHGGRRGSESVKDGGNFCATGGRNGAAGEPVVAYADQVMGHGHGGGPPPAVSPPSSLIQPPPPPAIPPPPPPLPPTPPPPHRPESEQGPPMGEKRGHEVPLRASEECTNHYKRGTDQEQKDRRRENPEAQEGGRCFTSRGRKRAVEALAEEYADQVEGVQQEKQGRTQAKRTRRRVVRGRGGGDRGGSSEDRGGGAGAEHTERVEASGNSRGEPVGKSGADQEQSSITGIQRKCGADQGRIVQRQGNHVAQEDRGGTGGMGGSGGDRVSRGRKDCTGNGSSSSGRDMYSSGVRGSNGGDEVRGSDRGDRSRGGGGKRKERPGSMSEGGGGGEGHGISTEQRLEAVRAGAGDTTISTRVYSDGGTDTRIVAAGRGRGMTTPAWMTRKGGTDGRVRGIGTGGGRGGDTVRNTQGGSRSSESVPDGGGRTLRVDPAESYPTGEPGEKGGERRAGSRGDGGGHGGPRSTKKKHGRRAGDRANKRLRMERAKQAKLAKRDAGVPP